jgi:hypothetical protein
VPPFTGALEKKSTETLTLALTLREKLTLTDRESKDWKGRNLPGFPRRRRYRCRAGRVYHHHAESKLSLAGSGPDRQGAAPPALHSVRARSLHKSAGGLPS